MTRSHLFTRVERLERHAHTHAEGVLQVWRLPEESDAEALARHEIDADDFPKVRVSMWVGARVSALLALPPSPVWLPRRLPVIADLESRLNEGMKRRNA